MKTQFYEDIIISPVVTERSMANAQMKKYTFRVDKKAVKPEIKKAVEKLFGVQVKDVNTISVRGQFRRQRNTSGYTPSWKKAIVTLTEDSKTIEFFEGMM